jgi:Ca2+:H+ antiporter
MPIISLLSYFFSATDEKFILIFPTLSIFAVILAVLTLVFVCKEGHTNYFIGIVLLMMYLILISAFYFIPSQDSEGGGGHH